MNERYRSLVVLLFLAICLVSAASAVRMGPVSKGFIFAPGTDEQYVLHVINDGGEELRGSVRVEGELTQYVEVTPEFSIAPGESERLITIVVHQPVTADDLAPGIHETRILVSAQPATDGQFGGAVTLVHRLTIRRLYDGAFLDGTLSIADGEPGEPLTATLSLSNQGLKAASATGNVLISRNALLEEIPFGITVIMPGADGKLEQQWLPAEILQRGTYHARALLRYDPGGVEREFGTDFFIGMPVVALDLPVVALHPNEVVQLSLSANTDWNEALDVAAIATLLRDGVVLASEKTPAFALRPGEDVFTAYLPVPDVTDGDVLMRVEVTDLKTGGMLGSTERMLVVAAPAEVVPHPQRNTAVIIGVVLIIILLLLGLALLRRRSRGA